MTALNEQARFDTRLPKEQKMFFEKAALLGGYRNLTEFIVHAVNEKAKEIIKEHEQVLVSRRDSEIFFDAIVNSAKPNIPLREAVEKYKSQFPE